MGINFFSFNEDVGKLLENHNDKFLFGVLTICALCFILLFANMLRRKIKFLRGSLMPTAVIGGLVGLAVKEIIKGISGIDIFDMDVLGAVVYHALPIAFIALCLREKDDYEYVVSKENLKIERVAAIKSGSVIISTYLLQGLIGIIVTALIGFTFMPELNKAVGIMLPLGFGQGPQQASATGGIWDKAGWMDFYGENINIARNFGITVAAMGLLWASVPGVILINRIAKKRGITIERNHFEKSGDLPSHAIEGKDEIPLSESIDKFSLQICMVGAVYLVTILLIAGLELMLNAIGIKFFTDLIPTFWGFSFMIAVFIALVAKMVLRKLVKSGFMHRKYPNSYMMNRISGAAFDISIAAALLLISVEALGMLWIPVIVMSMAGGFASIFYLKFLCNRIYKDYKDEAFLAMYGTLTGTIGNGMILLREIDKDFLTPAADDLVIGSSAAIILAFPLLILVVQAPKPNQLLICFLIILAYFLVLTAYQFKDLFKKKKINIKDEAKK